MLDRNGKRYDANLRRVAIFSREETMATDYDPKVAEIMNRLKEPFEPEVVQYRSGASSVEKRKALALAYVEARDVMNRLDEVLGAHGWDTELSETATGQIICKLTIHFADAGGVVHSPCRCDVGGTVSTAAPGDRGGGVDKLKAAASDALKRAAIGFGIGRYLYYLPNFWVDAEFGADGKVKWLKEKPKLPPWAMPAAEGQPPADGRPLAPPPRDPPPQQQPPQQQGGAPVGGRSAMTGGASPPQQQQPQQQHIPINDMEVDRLDYLFSLLPDRGVKSFELLKAKYRINDVRQLSTIQAQEAIVAAEQFLSQQKVHY
jgi:hypothetical protein